MKRDKIFNVSFEKVPYMELFNHMRKKFMDLLIDFN